MVSKHVLSGLMYKKSICENGYTQGFNLKLKEKQAMSKERKTVDLQKAWRTIDQYYFKRLQGGLAQVVLIVCT